MIILPPDIDILSPIDDHIFKTLLTHPDAKPVLTDVLSASIDRPIRDAIVRNNELPVTDTNEKGERLDVNCTVDNDDQADVEMHGSRIQEMDEMHTSLVNKCIYYLTDLHSSQKSKGVEYHKLARTYQITFCNYTVYPHRNEFVTRASMRTPDGEQITDQINFILIELSKLGEALKKPVDKLTPLEMWAIFFKYASDTKQRNIVNRIIAEKGEIAMAGAMLMEISKDEKERAHYRSRRMYETDKFHNESVIRQRAEAQGMAQGMAQGLTRAKLDFARKMKFAGKPIPEIIQFTDLSASEIESL